MSPDTPVAPGSRRTELAAALTAVRTRLTEAARAVGRDPSTLTLVVVSKFFPAADALTLLDLGERDLGESRDQEAAAKAAAVSAQLGTGASTGPPSDPPRWHFIGQLQTNKVRSVLGYASAVHSVDRLKLAHALHRAGEARLAEGGAVLDCFVQVDLEAALAGSAAGRAALGPRDPSAPRGGVAPDALEELTDAVAGSPALRLRGLMAVAPRGVDPGAAFAELAGLAARVRAAHPGADALSAGMSGDLEAAVAAGATHLRVGAAILGPRPPAR
ncbi:YggS family pyridoxal phosphate enzyme [Kineococcus gynurae]|uniref:Pyridoxal phosphate homeostasis protein n=1 Tax=Kineococcus gynurae TaxID=452979 RepID=A0ABV5LY14_9ACTN